MHLEFGQAALRRKDFAAALALFEQPMPLLLGSGGGVQPVRRMEDEAYQLMHYTLRLNAMESCNGMASALTGLGRDEEVRIKSYGVFKLKSTSGSRLGARSKSPGQEYGVDKYAQVWSVFRPPWATKHRLTDHE